MSQKNQKILFSIALVLCVIVSQTFVRIVQSNFEINESLILQRMIIPLILLFVIFGRLYCGILCQLGAVQRVLNWLGLLFLKKRIEIPKSFDKYLRYLKYLFLFSIIFLSVYHMQILYSPHLKVDQFSGIWPNIRAITLAIAGISIIGGILFNNFFCKYICVQGAMSAIAGLFSRLKLKRDIDSCINCRMCTKKCPVNLEVHIMDTIKSRECLQCFTCIIACPKKDILGFYFFGKKITYPLLLILSVTVYILLIIATTIILNTL